MSKNKIKWKTTLFEEAQAQKLSMNALARKGNNLYSSNYLQKIKAGQRTVPDSLTFQNWIAHTLNLPREQLFSCHSVYNSTEYK